MYCSSSESDTENSFFLFDDTQKKKKSALMVKEAIKKQGVYFQSGHQFQLKSDSVEIPKLLETFLVTLLTKDAVPSDRVF